MRLRLLFLLLLGSITLTGFSQKTPLWMRYPAISPDGQFIAFAYQGDLYKVPASGGAAMLLTTHEAHDTRPIWSHDGSKLAFASNRHGNYDVFVMPASGGSAHRITFHSAADYPTDFVENDNAVIFSSLRTDDASNQQFPHWSLSELYQVPVIGGRVTQKLTTATKLARISPDGNTLIFNDRKGGENDFRKHHTSSVARDLWSYDLKAKQYKQLTTQVGEDRNPVFSADGKTVYYLSEQNGGSFNIYKFPLANPSNSTAVTQLTDHPVRSLSSSNTDILCFGYDGEIYTLKPNGTPEKVSISIQMDDRYNRTVPTPVSGKVNQFALSPNEKEMAFIVRGEVFVTSIKEGTTRRITNTPEEERGVEFSPDGRSILYASERNGSWNLYQTSLKRESEKYFFNATLLDEEALLETPAETFQASYSPDGKEVALFGRKNCPESDQFSI